MDHILVLSVAVIAAVALVWYVWPRTQRGVEPLGDVHLPAGLSLHREPLLSKEEGAFYNILCLAVQEHYLVFAKVPVAGLLHVEPKGPGHEPPAARFRRTLGRSWADFVLLHPGSLTVATVIKLERGSLETLRRPVREQLAELALTAAGVRLVRIDMQRPYTIPALAALLGLEMRE